MSWLKGGPAKKVVALLSVILAGAMCLAGCAQESATSPVPSASVASASPNPLGDGEVACECAGNPVVDSALLAFLSKARAQHAQADLVEESDAQAAIKHLERLVDEPPADRAGPRARPEVVEVLADTHARLAELRSREGAFDAAGRDVTVGLGLATEPTHFRGRLFEVMGVVEQRRYKQLLASGNQGAAEQAKERAISAFGQAVEIQDEVIQQALSGLGSDAGTITPPF